MAKTVTCKFCGKELTKKFLGGDTYGYSIDPSYIVECCEECYDKYEMLLSKADKKRLTLKLDNYKYSTKDKLKDQQTIADFINTYITEKQQLENSREEYIAVDFKNNFYGIIDGKFYVEEFKLGWLDKSVSLNDMVKARDKSQSDITTTYFTKDDISKIEYRIASTGPVSVFRPFTHICSVDVRLNDEKNPGYRPAITRAVFVYYTFPIFLERRSAIKKADKILNEFKADIGSNLPVVRVKKFK